MNTGDRLPPGVGPVRGYDPQALDRIFREGIQEFSGLRRSIEDNPELKAELDALVREMQRLDPKRFPGNPALIEQMRQQLLPQIEHLELRLRRELDEQNSDQVRSATTERIPEGYAEAVAEYRRKLSNRK
jgi:hypothetical protein